LPIKRAAYKELRKSRKRHIRNISTRSELKTSVKRFEKLLLDKKVDEAKEFLKDLLSKIDRAASKGVIHRKAAHRKAARLSRRFAVLPKT
jgi:small subunit ribosomal protein S20